MFEIFVVGALLVIIGLQLFGLKMSQAWYELQKHHIEMTSRSKNPG